MLSVHENISKQETHHEHHHYNVEYKYVHVYNIKHVCEKSWLNVLDNYPCKKLDLMNIETKQYDVWELPCWWLLNVNVKQLLMQNWYLRFDELFSKTKFLLCLYCIQTGKWNEKHEKQIWTYY
jgi:hypothetical protein